MSENGSVLLHKSHIIYTKLKLFDLNDFYLKAYCLCVNSMVPRRNFQGLPCKFTFILSPSVLLCLISQDYQGACNCVDFNLDTL